MDLETKRLLKIAWNYMTIKNKIEKADIIIGCGCKNLKIPIRCTELLNQGYGKYIIFSGGFGKITKDEFALPEAELYKQIALEQGVDENKIYVENSSTNTGDNLQFSLEIIKKENLKYDAIILVHNNLSMRRTLNTAKARFKNTKLQITSPSLSFEEFIIYLEEKDEKQMNSIISVLVGDIQRMVIYPQLGWQIEEEVPGEVLYAYEKLKQKGYSQYIYTKEQIQKFININGIKQGAEPNYFS